MAERLHPGVYVEEVSSGLRPIEGVSTSTAAFLGVASRGIPGLPTLLTSFEDYSKAFGGHLPGERGFLGLAVAGFFDAGGRRAYAVRVMPANALAAQQEEAQPSRFVPASGEAAPALRFRAKGKGRWADAIRIAVLDGSNFPEETFRVEVSRSEAGATRTLEVFDDLRMDPDTEDYFAPLINDRSRYIQVTDEFQRANDENDGSLVPVPEVVPRLLSRVLKPNERHTLYEGVSLTLNWTDGSAAEPRTATVTFDSSPELIFLDGVAAATSEALGTVLSSQLAGTDFRVIRDGLTPGRIVIDAPAAGTLDLSGETLRFTVGGATTSLEIDDAVPDSAAVTRDQLLEALRDALEPDNLVASVGNQILVDTEPVLAGGAPTFSQTPGVRNLVVAPVVAGAAATPGEIRITIPNGGAGPFNLAGETLEISIAGSEVALDIDAAVPGVIANASAITPVELVNALTAALDPDVDVRVNGNAIVIEAAAALAGVTMALSQTPNANALTFTATNGAAATRGRIAITAPAAGTQDLSGETLRFTIGGITTAIAVQGQGLNPAAVTPQRLLALLQQGLSPNNTVTREGDTLVVTSPARPGGVPVAFSQTPNTNRLTTRVTPGLPTQRIAIEPDLATRGRLTIAAPGGAPFNLSGQTLTLTIDGEATSIDMDDAVGNPASVTPASLVEALTNRLGPDNIVDLVGESIVVRTRANSAGTAPAFQQTPGGAGVDQLAVVAVAGAPGTVVDSLDGIVLTVGEQPNRFFGRSLSSLGLASKARGHEQNAPANPLVRPRNTIEPLRLVGGFDGVGDPTVNDYSEALHSLDRTEVNLVAIPGQNGAAILSQGLTYCDRRGDCFFLADGPGHVDDDLEVGPADAKAFIEGLPNRSINGAMFYPWLQLPDPVGAGRNPKRYVPPSGHLAGIFARTDITRGVWKAPAGLEATVSKAIGLQYDLIDAEQDLLNPVSLNCLRRFPGAGIVSWGSRTLSSDPEWRYIPVRRTALFLKESLRRGLQWAVFEPNDQELWDRIRINIEAFMLSLFRQGAFQGGTPDEAFAVVCDRGTNPQELVDQGIVTARVAFAPLKPAEFVVIEISQKTLVGS